MDMKKGNLCFLTFFAATLLGNVPAFATPTSDDLKRIERQLQEERAAHLESQRQSDKLANEIRAVQKQMVRSAQAVQEKEDTLSQLETRLEELRKEEETLSQKLMQSKAQTVHLVTALQSLALKPKEQIFLEKQAPTQILRSRMMLNSAVPIAQRMTQDVLLDVEKLEETKVEIQTQIRKVKETMENLTSKTEHLNGLIAKKTKLQAEYDASHELSRKKIVALAGQANDLKELLQRLEKERQRQLEAERKKKQEQEEAAQKMARFASFLPIGSSFEKVKGSLPYPVVGQIVENYGDVTMKGMHAKGLTISTRAGAILRAPFKGTVLFSGPFKSYGKMLIIDCSDGYLLLLAGLDDINAFTGQEVIAGEPVGRMGAERTKLYIEIRKDGQAIDPGPWFRK